MKGGKADKLREKALKAFRRAEELRAEAEQARIVSIDELLNEYDRVFTVYVPEIGRAIRYKRLTIADLTEVLAEKDESRRALLMLYKMWSKADPDVTLEKVERLPMEVSAAILQAILQSSPFLAIRSLSNPPSKASSARRSGS